MFTSHRATPDFPSLVTRMAPIRDYGGIIDFAATGQRGMNMAQLDHQVTDRENFRAATRHKAWRAESLANVDEPLPMILRERGVTEARFKQDLQKMRVVAGSDQACVGHCVRVNEEYYLDKGIRWSFSARPYVGRFFKVDCSRTPYDENYLHQELDIFHMLKGATQMPMLLRDRGVPQERYDQDVRRMVAMAQRASDRPMDKSVDAEITNLCNDMTTAYYADKGIQWSHEKRPGVGQYFIIDCSLAGTLRPGDFVPSFVRHKEWSVGNLKKRAEPLPMIMRDRGVDEARFAADMARIRQLCKNVKRETGIAFCKQLNDEYYLAKGVQWGFEFRAYRGAFFMVDCKSQQGDGVQLHEELPWANLRVTNVTMMPKRMSERGVGLQQFKKDIARIKSLMAEQASADHQYKTVEMEIDKVTGGCCFGPVVHTPTRVTKSVQRDFDKEASDLCQEISSDYYLSKGVQWSYEVRPGEGRYFLLDYSNRG